MGEYKVTDEAIEAIVKKCPQSREALKAAFPKAFEEKWVLVDPSRIDVRIDRWSGDGSFRTVVQVDGRGIGVISPDGLRPISSMYSGEYLSSPWPYMGRLSVYEKK